MSGMVEHDLKLPLSDADVRALKVGDIVYVSGEIHSTAGIPTHKRMLECLARGEALPFDLKGGALFHLGSYNIEDADGGLKILYINPTTSTRFNDLMPQLIPALGLRLTGGKGGLDARSAQAMKDAGCVYLSFLGGGAPILTDAIKRVTGIGWRDMISHYRLVRIEVERLGPLTVAIDAHGNSVYDDTIKAIQDKRASILAELRADRERA
ncbi:fumarate hydratase C-terminal domain-containing protein [Pseudolabrys sp. FHR47]|uniref:fumarate hydratase C-terminal domain-containing protein n=1 Tax=Pseudolabrys sp. FHR47 TaxID=2562284 RepID=UPI00197DEE1A|nr:fumarate hydratase C-terminal domain-containing protein [Pseudolabrys sp. FHR47]